MNSTALIADGAYAPKSRGGRPRGFDFAGRRRSIPWGDPRLERDAAETLGSPGLNATPTSAAAPEEVDFRDLVERVAAQADRAAFARLFSYYAPRVKGYLLRLGLDAAQAEELTQEVMVAVWRKAATFDRTQASVATWIFRIARNRRIDLFRRERLALDAHDPALQPTPEAGPDGAAEAVEREARVRRAVAELSPDQRDLVREAFYEELSHSQIAEKTGLPLGTIKSRLRLAFAKLKLRLDADAPGADAGGPR